MIACPVIDLHAHVHRFSVPVGGFRADDLLRVMEPLGVELAVVSSSEAIVYDMRRGNAALSVEIARRSQLRGYVFANPSDVPGSLDELRCYLPEPQFIGLKLYSGSIIGQPLDCPGHREILSVVADEFPHAIVLFHCGENDPRNYHGLLAVARAYPQLTFLAGHMGSSLWREALPVLAEAPNVIAEICAPVPARPRIEDAVRIMGPERVVFGSDFPLIHPAYALGCVRDADIPAEHKELILYGNAKRILRRAEALRASV